MRVRIRPYLMAGMAVVAAGSISAPSAVNPLSTAPTRHDTVALSAQAKPFDPLPAGLVTVPAPAPGSGPAELPKLLAEALETAETDRRPRPAPWRSRAWPRPSSTATTS
jgi:hypothetical protein